MTAAIWLALFAPRNQLVEFVLREDDYRRRMIETIDPAFWIAPSLSSGASFLEPIQGGARKKLNMLKPWSPSWSYGLVARCDVARCGRSRAFTAGPTGHPRRHLAAARSAGRCWSAPRGSGRIVAIDLSTEGERRR